MPASPRELRPINGGFVRDRRILGHLSQRTLAAALGATQQVIYRIEHGMRQNELDVSFLVDLAEALGVSVTQLFAGGESVVPRSACGDVCDETDPAAVGSVLASTSDWVIVDDIADALGWTLERTFVALDTLAERLAPVGQRLAWLNDREVRLAGDVDDEPAVRRVTRRAVETFGLQQEEAFVVALAANGGHTARHRYTLMTLRRLVRAGLITTAPVVDGKQDDGPRLTDLARFNLFLDELDWPDGRTIPAVESRTTASRWPAGPAA